MKQYVMVINKRAERKYFKIFSILQKSCIFANRNYTQTNGMTYDVMTYNPTGIVLTTRILYSRKRPKHRLQ